jgi:hypothetical protein
MTLNGQRLGDDNCLRLSTIHCCKLGSVLTGLLLVLLLHGQRRQATHAHGGQLRSRGRKIDTSAAATVTDTVIRCDVGHVRDVGVVYVGHVYIRDLAVVIELVIVPITTVVAAADVAVAVIHAAIVADVAAPGSTVKAVAAGYRAPVSRRP